MQSLEGKVVVVMGAGQTPGETVGNGRAAALLYARAGAQVAAVDRDADSAQETAELIHKEGGTAISAQADVTNEDDVRAVIASAVAEFGAINVLHNNVGVSHRAGDALVTEIEPEAFLRIQSINVMGMLLACKHVIPVMKAHGGGAIVNIGSNAALVDYPNVGYKTSKTAVIALTQNVAMRHAAYHIRANVILPGMMDTPMAVERQVGLRAQTRDEVVADRTRRTPLQVRGTAWDVAKAAVFLASDDASFITGASLLVDGGQSLVVG